MTILPKPVPALPSSSEPRHSSSVLHDNAEIEVAADGATIRDRVQQLVRQAVASLLMTDQAAFRCHTAPRHPINRFNNVRVGVLDALRIILERTAFSPPLLPSFPNYLGILSTPPCLE